MRKVVYVAGNPLVPEDSIPIHIMPRLQELFPYIEFRELEPTGDMPEEKTLNIIDTVLGLDEVKTVSDIEKIVTGKIYSLHDFDLGFTLKLMKKAGKLEKARIIGVPAGMDEESAFNGVVAALRKL
jgi:Ni,Fe-hydrogenase maturation factor